MAYEFYIGGTQLPVTPGKLQLKYNGNNKTVTLIDQGEINVLKLPGLTDISFDMLLPSQDYPFASTSDTAPGTMLGMLEAYKQNKEPFQFVVVRTLESGRSLHGLSMRVSLEDYETNEDADEYGTDVCVTVNLKQYKDYGTRTVNIQPGGAASAQREQDNAPATPATVAVSKADNPVVMARIYNNSSETASDIADDNGYGSTEPDGTFSRDYKTGTNTGSNNAASAQSNKNKAAVTIAKKADLTAGAKKIISSKSSSSKTYDLTKTSGSSSRPTATNLLSQFTKG